jgi:hypothetical protein
MDDEAAYSNGRRAWRVGGSPEEDGWLSLNDDELLHHLETIGSEHSMDETLLRIVCSDRHFYIRQEAAKRIRDAKLLLTCADDRHVGQILVRHLSRVEDVEYLERLAVQSRYLDVRKAARAQLGALKFRLGESQSQSES